MRRTTGMTDEVKACLAEMGVTAEILQGLRAASNHTDGARLLDEAKELLRKGFRAAARENHPDLNQQLSPLEIHIKEERFKRLKSVYDSFMKATYRGPQRSRTQPGAANFDPFGFYSARNITINDIVRGWNEDQARQNATRLRREAERDMLIRMARETLDEINRKAKK